MLQDIRLLAPTPVNFTRLHYATPPQLFDQSDFAKGYFERGRKPLVYLVMNESEKTASNDFRQQSKDSS